MSRKKSEFLGALGIAFEIFKAIADAVIAIGGTDDDLRCVVSERGLANRIAEVIMAGRAVIEILEVNYDLAFEAMVAAGHYDYRNPNITAEYFPNQATGVRRYKPVLVSLGRNASTKEALAEIQGMGLIPASAAELLAYGAKHPEEQRKYPIIALGQAGRFSDYSCFPSLGRNGGGRRLTPAFGCSDWLGHCRFLALHEVS
jgi:hypothetical protein